MTETAKTTAMGVFERYLTLCIVVGVLIEVPVMLTVVKVVRRSRDWYERGPVTLL